MVIYLVIIGVAVGVDDIEAVFNIVGAVCSTSIGILLPCFFYVKLISMKKQRKNWKYFLSAAMFWVFGLFAIFAIISEYIQE